MKTDQASLNYPSGFSFLFFFGGGGEGRRRRCYGRTLRIIVQIQPFHVVNYVIYIATDNKALNKYERYVIKIFTHTSSYVYIFLYPFKTEINLELIQGRT
jgi:hypothetical protein